MIRPFWFRNPPNYGDIMTPFLLRSLNVKHQFADRNSCDSIFIGSIAKLARPNMNVYGSGFIRKNDPVCKDANWHFVRGPLTRQMILESGGSCPEIYGDAALILPEIIKPSLKKHDVGYCPHGVEFNLFPNNEYKIQLYHPDVKKVTDQITSCRKIISSSLHGIIVAMAYGIPTAYVSKSDKLSGDGMKFVDFYRSVGLEPILSTVENPVFQVPANINVSEILKILKSLKS